eukprot:scaffold12967_cov199-Amphora_coffeaeformis.AAC.1
MEVSSSYEAVSDTRGKFPGLIQMALSLADIRVWCMVWSSSQQVCRKAAWRVDTSSYIIFYGDGSATDK